MEKGGEMKIKVGVLWMRETKTVLVGFDKAHVGKALKRGMMSCPIGMIRKHLEEGGLNWDDVEDLDFVPIHVLEAINDKAEKVKEELAKEMARYFKEFMEQKYGNQKDSPEEKK